MRAPRSVQTEMSFRTHGGKRPGAGRPKDGRRNLVSHGPRPEVTESTPVHVTLRVLPEVYSLRSKRSFATIQAALRAARAQGDVRIAHYSVQGNHVHLVVEAPDRQALARRIKGLSIRVARAMNGVMHRRGRVFADRYHVRVLTKPRDVRNVLAYVLKNRQHHLGGRAAPIDPYSSASVFDGWDVAVGPAVREALLLVSPAASWLLRVGWKRHGPIPLRASAAATPR